MFTILIHKYCNKRQDENGVPELAAKPTKLMGGTVNRGDFEPL